MRDQKGRFLKGNTARHKAGRRCMNYPFCKELITTRLNGLKAERPDKAYCGLYCKKKAKKYRKLNNLVKKGGKNG